MKKGIAAILLVLALSIGVVTGIFIERTSRNHYVRFSGSDTFRFLDSTYELESGAVDINTATQAQLQGLPGIGDTLAQRIVDYREVNGYFRCIEDLMNVEGIGNKKIEQIRHLIRIGD